MAVILKSDSRQPDDKATAARDVSGLAGFNLCDLADEGRARLMKCREQISEMKVAAAVEAEQVREDAEARGYEEGLKRAAVDADEKRRQEAEQISASELVAMRAAVTKVHTTYGQWMQQYAELLNTVAIAAAEKLIRKKLGEDQEVFLAWAEEALRNTRSASRLTLAVHPETLAELGQRLDELLASPELPEETHVVPDESVPLLEITVRQPGGEVKAGLMAQLDRLAEMLR